MPKFDRYSSVYTQEIEKSVGFIGHDHTFFLQVKADLLINLIERRLGAASDVRVLDVGCGIGTLDQILIEEVSSLDGVDTSGESILRAKQGIEQATFQHYDGEILPYEDNRFDLVFTVCVIHHVKQTQWQSFVSEMARVSCPGGIVVIVEHNPFNPLTRLVVNRCPFDDDAILLPANKSRRLLLNAGLYPIEQKYFMFLPFRHTIVRAIEKSLVWLPLGAQYYVAATKCASDTKTTSITTSE